MGSLFIGGSHDGDYLDAGAREVIQLAEKESGSFLDYPPISNSDTAPVKETFKTEIYKRHVFVIEGNRQNIYALAHLSTAELWAQILNGYQPKP